MDFKYYKCTSDPNALYRRYVTKINKQVSQITNDNFLSPCEIEEIKIYKALVKAEKSISNFDLVELLKALFLRAYIFGYKDTVEYFNSIGEKNEEK